MDSKIEIIRFAVEKGYVFDVTVYVWTGGGWTGFTVAEKFSHTRARLVEKAWWDSFMTDERRQDIVFNNRTFNTW